MRHKYETRGIVLSRSFSGEANVFVTLLTPSLGLVCARAQGVRKSGAKLAAALATFTESELVCVRGRESWRVAGAMLQENWFTRMRYPASRARASRVSGLLLRLVAGEMREVTLFPIVKGFFGALTELPNDAHDAAEVLAVLRILAALGLDEGEIPGTASEFAVPLLTAITKERPHYIVRINRGITASGL